jgi:hypothetical protein
MWNANPGRAPEKKQRQSYSGKKKRHTLKSQVALNPVTGMSICTAFAKGRVHDFRRFKQTRLPLPVELKVLADKGYQGLLKLHPNSQTPKKKPKGGGLSPADKRDNRGLARRRVILEQVNRCLKIWRILSERDRNRRRRFGLRFNLIAGLYNFELTQRSPEAAI